MFKVLLETEVCEWENSGEGKEMPKKMIQVSKKHVSSHLKIYLDKNLKRSVRSLRAWRLPPTLYRQSTGSRSQVFEIDKKWKHKISNLIFVQTLFLLFNFLLKGHLLLKIRVSTLLER